MRSSIPQSPFIPIAAAELDVVAGGALAATVLLGLGLALRSVELLVTDVVSALVPGKLEGNEVEQIGLVAGHTGGFVPGKLEGSKVEQGKPPAGHIGGLVVAGGGGEP